MSEPAPADRLARLANAGWSDVCDRILAGLCHDLNGRVTSLTGMLYLLQLDDDPASITPFLDKEVSRLSESVLLIRRLAGELDDEPEALHLPDILPALVELFDKHRHLEAIETTLTHGPDLFPVVSRPTLLSRCFLLLLSLAGHSAAGRDRRLSIDVAVGGAGMARIRAVAHGGLNDAVALPPRAAREEGMAALAALIGASWHCEESPHQQVFEIALPLMTKVAN